MLCRPTAVRSQWVSVGRGRINNQRAAHVRRCSFVGDVSQVSPPVIDDDRVIIIASTSARMVVSSGSPRRRSNGIGRRKVGGARGGNVGFSPTASAGTQSKVNEATCMSRCYNGMIEQRGGRVSKSVKVPINRVVAGCVTMNGDPCDDVHAAVKSYTQYPVIIRYGIRRPWPMQSGCCC